jgi:outer membrane protein OmpA-like peptidoglycan-associated protein
MRFLVCIVFLFPAYGYAQNLLVNPGFEEENICSEYKVNCAPEGWIYTVPSFIYYYKDPALAHEGSRFISLIAGHSEKPYYRTFVRSRLLCALQKDKNYRLGFFVKSVHPILDSMGVYFSSYDFLFEKQAYQKIKPALYFANAANRPIKGDTGWQKISFVYKATGDEIYMTLGNFSKKGLTGSTRIYMEKNFFVLFDDVSLLPVDVNERLCMGWQKTREEIYGQDERHEFLERYVKTYKNNPPALTKPSPTITLHIDTLIIPDVFFATNSFMLNAKAVALLDSFSRQIIKYKLDSINVFGHTDSRGTESFNKELSWRRANSVAAYLENKLPVKIHTEGKGSDVPVADNRTVIGRRKNRRVEIFLYIKD